MTLMEEYINSKNFVSLKEHEMYYEIRMRSVCREGNFYTACGKYIVPNEFYEVVIRKELSVISKN